MSVAIVIITDGRRDCFTRTVTSLREAWGDNHVDRIVIVNDSADDYYRDWLNQHYAGYERVHHDVRRGFAGAIQSAWDAVAGSNFVFHLEDDFVFNEPLDVVGMCELLTVRPNLVQVALKRQPWNPEERAAGGFMEQHPEDYHDEITHGHRWCWQRRFFTTNPSFYRGWVMMAGWPQEENSEGKFGLRLMEKDPDLMFGFWGHKADPPKVMHIGEQRVGTGY